MVTLVYGGAGSGKSEYAEGLAVSNGSKCLYYIATMIPVDSENEKKIDRHRRLRANKNFETIECYTDIESVSLTKDSTVLLECVSNWVANEMFSENGAKDEAVSAIKKGIDKLISESDNVIFVSNNIFEDGKRYDDFTVKYMKNLSEVNKYIAKKSDQAIEINCGIPFFIKKID